MDEAMTKDEKQRFIDMMMKDFGLSYAEALERLATIEGIHPARTD